MNTRRRAIIGSVSKQGGGLPAEYQQVEYLESTGEQYIDTGIVWQPSESLFVKFSLSELSNGTVFGNISTGGVINRCLYYNGTLNYQTASNSPQTIYTPSLLEVMELSVDNLILSINDTPKLSITNTVQNQNLTIFAVLSAAGQPISYSKDRLYALNVSNTCNFISCYRKSDNKPGLYDTVTATFFTNANTSASTDFIVGPDV